MVERTILGVISDKHIDKKSKMDRNSRLLRVNSMSNFSTRVTHLKQLSGSGGGGNERLTSMSPFSSNLSTVNKINGVEKSESKSLGLLPSVILSTGTKQVTIESDSKKEGSSAIRRFTYMPTPIRKVSLSRTMIISLS